MQHPKIEIATIIVNYATAEILLAHLDKIICAHRGFDDWRIFIVDNASPDDEYSLLQHRLTSDQQYEKVELINAGANLGFAGANNIAYGRAVRAGAEYVFFLNPDAYPDPQSISTLYDFLKATPEAAIAGARLVNEAGQNASCCFQFPTAWIELASEAQLRLIDRLALRKSVTPPLSHAPLKTDWVSGAAFMLRVSATPSELMDPEFFLYFEETDLMLRLHRQGWETWHVPASRIVHIGGVATGVQHDQPATRAMPAYWFDSWRRYYHKNYGGLYAVSVGIAKFTGLLIYNAKVLLLGRKNGKPTGYTADVFSRCIIANFTDKTRVKT